jgi:PAS domain S-box-containing protein
VTLSWSPPEGPPARRISNAGNHHRRARRYRSRLPAGHADLKDATTNSQHRPTTDDALARAERDLEESQERLRMALEATDLGVWDYDPQTRELRWSDRCRALFGLSPGAPVDYDRFLAGLHPDDRDQIHAEVLRALDPAGGGSYAVEYRTVGLEDGVERWVAATGRATFDRAGQPVRFIGTVLDISERKRAELELRERARQAELGARVGVALTSTDPLSVRLQRCAETLVEQLDAAFARIWTLNAATDILELQASAGLYTHLDGPHSRIAVGQFKIGRIAQSRRPHLTNTVLTDPEIGDPDWAAREGMRAFAGYPLSVGGHLVGVMGLFSRTAFSSSTLRTLGSVADSIAVAVVQGWIERERDRLMESERAARDEAETLLRTVSLIATELDLERLVQAVTDVSTSVSGAQFGAFFYNVVDASGESYTLYTIAGVPREAFSQFPMPRNTQIFAPTFRGQGTVRLDDVTADPRYGQNPPYHGMPPGHLPVRSYLAVPVISRQGEVLGGLFFGHARPGVFTERAERLVAGIAAHAAVAIDNARLYAAERTAREDLKRQAEQLATANRELEAFSYSVSHDLRTPLRAMDGFSRILLEEYAEGMDPEARRYLQIVRNGARQMGELVDDLLTFSRLGRQALELRMIEPARLVQEAWADLRHEREGRKIEFHIDELPAGYGDPALIRLVFANLLANAIKFSRGRDPAIIHVGCEMTGPGEVAYFVQDNGVGFDMRYANKLFGVFQRLHRAEEYEGTGVGLANVQRIVHRHGGRVWAQAESGKGARFSFTLATAEHAAEPTNERHGGHDRR